MSHWFSTTLRRFIPPTGWARGRRRTPWTTALLSLVVLAAPGCYRAHEVAVDDPPGAGSSTDAGTRVEVIVLTDEGHQAPRPAAGALVVVEDCASGATWEAVSGANGAARFDSSGATCWNVTAVIGDEALSVLRAPVPLPGPLVFPREVVVQPSDVLSPWQLEVEDYEGGFLQLSAPGVRRGLLTFEGLVDRDMALREGIAVVIHDEPENEQRLRGEIVNLVAVPGGPLRARSRLPLASSESGDATVEVMVQASNNLYAQAFVDEGSRIWNLSLHVTTRSPGGGLYEVSFPTRFTRETLTPTRCYASFRWVMLRGASGWSPPRLGGTESLVRARDACANRIASWGDIPAVSGGHRSVIPGVTVSDHEGSSLDELVIDVGGAGHRGRMVLRTAGPQPFRWSIESFEVGRARFEGVPPLPATVEERVALSGRSVYVQFGVVAPSAASYAPDDSYPLTVPWWFREGFILGDPAEFGPELAHCPATP